MEDRSMSDSEPLKQKGKTLGETIQAHRERARLSQRQLAAQVGLHYSVLSRIESGEVERPSGELLQHLAEALNIDPADLLAFVGVKPSLPEPKMYFRRKLGMNAKDADVLAKLVEEYQENKEGRKQDD
jgi:transcriptional regulator with XRE-family HTH domain